MGHGQRNTERGLRVGAVRRNRCRCASRTHRKRSTCNLQHATAELLLVTELYSLTTKSTLLIYRYTLQRSYYCISIADTSASECRVTAHTMFAAMRSATEPKDKTNPRAPSGRKASGRGHGTPSSSFAMGVYFSETTCTYEYKTGQHVSIVLGVESDPLL